MIFSYIVHPPLCIATIISPLFNISRDQISTSGFKFSESDITWDCWKEPSKCALKRALYYTLIYIQESQYKRALSGAGFFCQKDVAISDAYLSLPPHWECVTVCWSVLECVALCCSNIGGLLFGATPIVAEGPLVCEISSAKRPSKNRALLQKRPSNSMSSWGLSISCVCMFVCVCVSMIENVCVYVYFYTHIRIGTTRESARATDTHPPIDTVRNFQCLRSFVKVIVWLCVRVCVCVCAYLCLGMYIHVYIYAYTHVHTSTTRERARATDTHNGKCFLIRRNIIKVCVCVCVCGYLCVRAHIRVFRRWRSYVKLE